MVKINNMKIQDILVQQCFFFFFLSHDFNLQKGHIMI